MDARSGRCAAMPGSLHADCRAAGVSASTACGEVARCSASKTIAHSAQSPGECAQGLPGAAARLDGKIALGIESHRTVAQVRRSDTEQIIVDRKYLAVYIEASLSQSWNVRTVQTITLILIRRFQTPMQAGTQHTHGRLFQPAALGLRRHNQHFRPIRLAQPGGQRIADQPRCEILALEEQMAPCRSNRIEVQLPNLMHTGAPSNAGSVREIAISMSVRSGVNSAGHRSGACAQ